MLPIVFSCSPTSVGVLPVLRSPPLESSPSFMGSMEGDRLPATPLTPSQATASRPAMELGVVGESSEVTVSFGCLNVGVACHVVRGFPSIALCLEHVCAGGGGGGRVAFEGFVLYAGGIYALSPNAMLLVQVWPT